jgi:hypothetical protein
VQARAQVLSLGGEAPWPLAVTGIAVGGAVAAEGSRRLNQLEGAASASGR